MGKGGGTQTTTQQFQGPGYTLQGGSASGGQTPGMTWQDYLGQSNAITNDMWTNPQNYIYGLKGQQLVASQDPLTKTAQKGQNDLASGMLLNPGVNYYMNTISGQNNNPYEGENPHLQNMIDAANWDTTRQYQTAIQPQLSSAAARAGAFGGSGDQQQQQLAEGELAKALANNEANIRGQNYYNSGNLYQQDQQNAMNAASGMQSTNNQWMQNLAALNQSGQQNQQYGQSIIDAAKNLMNQNSQWNSSVLDLRGNALSRASGQGGTSTSQALGPGFSTGQGIAGGLLALLGL